MYEEEPYYQPRARSPVPAAVFTSILTTVAVFFVLRVLEERGLLPGTKGKPAPDAVEVPSLLGIRPDQAREILKGRDLMLTISSERETPQYPAGTIADQTPLPGSQATKGSAVQAVISRGMKQVQVPNLVGLRTEEALKQLTVAGLATGPQKTAASDTAAAGTVVQIEPAAGTAVQPQATVTLVVSSGPSQKAIPKLVGMRLRTARTLLEEQGFKLGKIRYIVDGDRASGVVLEQQPAPAVPAAPGSTVDLIVNGD